MFCGGRAAPKEDASPLWFVRFYPQRGDVMGEAPRGPHAPLQWRQRGHFCQTKFVCKLCNNGWMSLLEEKAKPVIERLLSNERASLEGAERELAARWILKTAMVFEAIGGREWFYKPDERALVRSGSIPPGYTAFW